jgi:hypothetical protein
MNFCLLHSGFLLDLFIGHKEEVILSSETSVEFHRPTRCYIPEDMGSPNCRELYQSTVLGSQYNSTYVLSENVAEDDETSRKCSCYCTGIFYSLF